MKAFVDREGCIGCTLCASICPSVFTMDGEKAKSMDGDIPERCVETAIEAQESCPVSVIKVE